eukprot:m51a1_g1009 putative myosin light chain kinase (408) ;mRNA; f:595525-597322
MFSLAAATQQDNSEPEEELVSITVDEGKGVQTASKDPSAQVFLRFRIDNTAEAVATRPTFADHPRWSGGETIELIKDRTQRSALVQLMEKGHHTTPNAETLLADTRVQLQNNGIAGKWIKLDKRRGKGEIHLVIKVTPVVPVSERWDIRKRVGTGAHGIVYEAIEKNTGDIVAIKVINKDTESAQDIKGLMREIANMKKLEHPNIVKLHEVVLTKKTLSLVMEYVEGRELFSKINSCGHLNEQDARTVFNQVVTAVSYLHSRGVAHRDLKPENILVAEGLKVKLTDFGLSIDSNISWMKTVCGSPSYVAPEVLQCLPYTIQCDMWSLGVLLFAMLSGQLPFAAESTREIYEVIMRGLFFFEGAVWESISSTAKDLIEKLLVVDASRRISAAECLRHEWLRPLQQCLE